MGTLLAARPANATDVYIAPGGSGTTGASWNSPADFDTYFALWYGKTTTATAIPAGTHIYIKAGNYTVNPILEALLINNDILIQGGFPSAATGTDRSGYNPTSNITKITLTGGTGVNARFLASSGAASGTNTAEIKGIEFTTDGVHGGSFFYGNSGSSGTRGVYKFTDLYVHGFPGGNGTVLIRNGVGSSTFTNCLFQNNGGVGGQQGVAICNDSNLPITIVGSSFVSNTSTSTSWGGSVFTRSNLIATNSNWCSNTSAGFGGAIGTDVNAVVLTITGCTFYNNQALNGKGGAIGVKIGNVNVTNSNFYENKAIDALNGGGGAISVQQAGGSNSVSSCVFYKNGVQSQASNGNFNGGGAIFAEPQAGSWTISSSKFVSNYVNQTYLQGGAIYFQNEFSGNSVTITNSLFYGNNLGGNSTKNGIDIQSKRAAFAGAFNISGSKLQNANGSYLSAIGDAQSSTYNFSNDTFGNTTDDGGVGTPVFNCPTAISPICLAADDPAPSFATTTFANLCPATTVTLPSTATNQNADVTLTWHSATPATNANKLPSNVVSTPGTYYAAFYDASSDCYSPTTTPVTVTINSCPVPDLTPIIYARPGTVYNTTPITVVVDVLELKAVATSGLITVKLTKDPLVSLSFPASSVSVGGRSVQNGSWSYDGVSDPGYYIFTTTTSILAGDQLSFGMEGILSPGATGGSVTISVTISGGSGGEVKVSNNADADKIDYFQQ